VASAHACVFGVGVVLVVSAAATMDETIAAASRVPPGCGAGSSNSVSDRAAGAGAGAAATAQVDEAGEGSDDEGVACSLDLWKKSLEAPRHAFVSKCIHAQWVHEVGHAKIVRSKGTALQTFGVYVCLMWSLVLFAPPISIVCTTRDHPKPERTSLTLACSGRPRRRVDGSMMLPPAETLFLLDAGSLILFGADASTKVPFREAYMMLARHTPPHVYRVYAALRNEGYVVVPVDKDGHGTTSDAVRIQFEVFALKTFSKRNPGHPLFSVVVVQYVFVGGSACPVCSACR